MVKALLLDCGGVMVAPSTGDWMLPPGYEEILGGDFVEKHLDAYRVARRAFVPLLPDACEVDTDEEECELFVTYYDRSLRAIDVVLSIHQLQQLAWLQTYRDDRYLLFRDVLPFLGRWREQYRLGIVSDAPPSTRRIMDLLGVSAFIDGATYSCDIGALKPDPAIYRNTLRLLGVSPEEAVFVDDMPEKLDGARALGIRCIQMKRQMPPLFPASQPWDGPSVDSFEALDEMLKTMAET